MKTDERCFDKLNNLRLQSPLSPKISKDFNVQEVRSALADPRPKETPIKPGYTPLMLAVAKGDTDATTVLLAKGARLNYEAESGDCMTPLVLAIKQRDIGMIKYLLEREADVNFLGTRSGWTPLLYAIIIEDVHTVEFLLKHGADPSFESKISLKPDILEEEHMSVLNTMKFVVEQLSTTTIIYPLMLAVVKKNKAIVNILLDYKANVNHTTVSPLTCAIVTCSADICQILLKRGADPNQDIGDGFSPLMAAIKVGEVAVIDVLINNRADMNLQVGGLPLLHYAVIEANAQVLGVLIRRGININIKNSKNITTLELAIRLPKADKTKQEKIAFLLDNGANVNDSHDNTTPLVTSIEEGDPEIIGLLLDKGADIEQLTPQKYSPLATALKKLGEGKIKDTCVKLLLHRGADIERKVGGSTPLGYAVSCGDINMARLLKSCGANPYRVFTEDGTSPLIYAKKHNMVKMVKTLERA